MSPAGREVPIQAVVFDAFDTLCQITKKLHPFAEIARASVKDFDRRHELMTRALGVREATELFGCTGIDVVALEQRLEEELASVRLFEDTIPTLMELKSRGIKLAIASNLAAPYAQPLLDLLPVKFDAYAWSFEVGYLKPHPEIFELVTKRLGMTAAVTLMVGDRYESDYLGAVNAGLQARHLVRSGATAPAGHCIKSLAEVLDLPLAEGA
jgi:HAD superfamily hydrolase (TIGR01549 family)